MLQEGERGNAKGVVCVCVKKSMFKIGLHFFSTHLLKLLENIITAMSPVPLIWVQSFQADPELSKVGIMV